MDESIRMTVVVNPLVTPLLFEQLRDCKSARTRAARLKALAEASLRQQLVGNATPDPPQPSRNTRGSGPTQVADPPADEGFQVLRITDSADQSNNEDDTGSLADAFAGYF